MIKICGVRTVDDARACAEAGATAVGLNLWPGSKRYLPFADAGVVAAALPPSVRRFAVLVNPSDEEVRRAFSIVDTVQLHGDETPARVRELSSLGRIMKAVRLTPATEPGALDAYPGELLLVDADAPGYGGSGQRADVALARSVAARRAVLLAGGLDPDNVADAIRQVRPFGVDVAGGVESAPGIKDHVKITAFVARARAALSQLAEEHP